MLYYEYIDPEVQVASENFLFVEEFLRRTNRKQIGWHYLTDITWIISKARIWPKSFKILDAGGGNGPLQYLLAEMGFDVVNIDMNLASLSPILTKRYSATLEKFPSYQPTNYKKHLNRLKSPKSKSIKNLVRNSQYFQKYIARKYIQKHDSWRRKAGLGSEPIGTLQWIVGNLCHIPEIGSDYFDAVVSLSALEHIPCNQIANAFSEIGRILKPDAKWAVTTSGTEKKYTWFHDPSKGYCFSETDLKEVFNANSLFGQDPEKVLQKYKDNNYLKNNLADFYFKSGDNGMPWGRWDPQYIPVGLFN